MTKTFCEKIKRCQLLAAIALFMTGCMGGSFFSSLAAQIGSIYIRYAYDDGNTPIEGAEFSVIQIASAQITGGSVLYTMLSPYDLADYDPNSNEYGNDTSMPVDYLELYETYGSANARTGITSLEGSISFGGCEAGLYLVWQSGAVEGAQDYEYANPVVVSVPVYEGDAWNYVCYVYPKTTRIDSKENTTEDTVQDLEEEEQDIQEVQEEDEEDITQQQETGVVTLGASRLDEDESEETSFRSAVGTGDVSHMELWFLIAIAAIVLLILWLYLRQRRRY